MKKTTAKPTTEANTVNKPAFELKLNGIRVSVWRNTSENGAWFNTLVTRRYRDSAGEWKDTNTLSGLGDICLALEALRLARKFVEVEEAARTSDENAND